MVSYRIPTNKVTTGSLKAAEDEDAGTSNEWEDCSDQEDVVIPATQTVVLTG